MLNDLPKDIMQLASKSEGSACLQNLGRKGRWRGRRRSWGGLVCGRGREGPPALPDGSVTDFAHRWHLPALPPALPFPPGLAPQ